MIIEFWLKISVNTLKSVMTRPFSLGLSILIILVKFFSIYGGNCITIFVMWVFAQHMVLKIHSFRDTLSMFMSQKKTLRIRNACTWTMPIQYFRAVASLYFCHCLCYVFCHNFCHLRPLFSLAMNSHHVIY